MSAFDHTIINDGNSGGLFRGVILGSGSVLGTESIDSVKAQEVYDTVVSRAGCSQSSASLECLRGLDADTLLEKASSLNKEFKWLGGNPPYGPRPDPADTFFPRNADAALVAGKFAKVPVLTGNSEDEGTLFAILMANITTNQILVDYMSTYYPGREQFAAGLVSKYPNDLGISGSPFRTGLQNNIFGQYKRLAAILGDITFIMQRRYHLSMIASHVPCWSYLSSSLHGLPTLGSFHGGDGMQTLSSSTGSPAVTQRRYVISFINTLDPNGLGISSPLIQFPKYTPADRRLVHMQKSSNTLLKDDFRAEQYQYFSENISKLRL
jgi:triacylglycerol lipase